MKLDRQTVCSLIQIRSPRWKQRIVGIAHHRVSAHNEIEIQATDKFQRKYYPENLYGSGDMIRACETQELPSGVKLYLVPINKLEVLERI